VIGLLVVVLKLKEPEPAVINKVKYPASHSSKPIPTKGTIQFGRPVMMMMMMMMWLWMKPNSVGCRVLPLVIYPIKDEVCLGRLDDI
jgi:hypothetical protein